MQRKIRNQYKWPPKSVVGHASSFAEGATDGKLIQPSSPIVKGGDEGFDWLHRSAIGILPSPRNVAFLREAFIVLRGFNTFRLERWGET